MGVVDIDVLSISSYLKEELAWATDKWLLVITTYYNVIYKTVRALMS